MGGATEDKAQLEERRKKFANPEGGGVSLDDEIAKNKNKSKPINKPHKKFRDQPQQQQGGNFNQNRPFNNSNRPHQQRPQHNHRFQQKFRR